MKSEFHLWLKYALLPGLLLQSAVLNAGNAVSLLSGRGFHLGKCYQHPAIRKCYGKASPHRCALELFSLRTGRINIPVDRKLSKDDGLIEGEDTTDYGVFLFRLTQAEEAEVLKVDRKPIREWWNGQDKESSAHSVSCPQR